MLTSFINVLIGFILGNVAHVMTRDKISGGSPTKFSFIFWIKDNYIKLLHSLGVACLLNLLIQYNLKDIEGALGVKWYGLYSVAIGLFPDAFLSFLKDRFGFLQPKKVSVNGKEYERKDVSQ